MFTCTLEPASRTPLCEQLYTALKREMESGGIRPGERMPSKRELAAHLIRFYCRRRTFNFKNNFTRNIFGRK